MNIIFNTFNLFLIYSFINLTIQTPQNYNNITKFNNRENLIFLYILLFNLILLLIVIIGFCLKIGYKKYIDNNIVI